MKDTWIIRHAKWTGIYINADEYVTCHMATENKTKHNMREGLWYHSMKNQIPTDVTVNSEPTIQGHDHPTKHRSRP